MILNDRSPFEEYQKTGGGKALKLYELMQAGASVPPFIVVSNDFFLEYLRHCDLLKETQSVRNPKVDQERIAELFDSTPLPKHLQDILSQTLESANLMGKSLAVRSSGLDEDSSEHSFAGMFSSFLFQQSIADVESSIRRCWASAYGERALNYRLENGLPTESIKMGVIIQKMVESGVSGVMFTRNPMDPLDRDHLVIDSLYGQCEALVSGELDADHFKVNRKTLEFELSVAEKSQQLVRSTSHPGLIKVDVRQELINEASLSQVMIEKIATIGLELEKSFAIPLDIEWAMEDQVVSIVQARPITTLPPESFYEEKINGNNPTLWDNSNIVESFAGVTTPLTFSATKRAYAIVYRQTCRLMGVPERIIQEYDDQFENMLGLIKGRVYYNLINWYKLLLLMPGSSSSKGFMETMMGVKEELNQKHQDLFDFVNSAPKYGILKKVQVGLKLALNFWRIDRLVSQFSNDFDVIYQKYNKTDFNEISLKELKNMYRYWEKNVTYNWKPPIINDFLCMVFFGALKSMTEKWIASGPETISLQNDLLCGQGDLDSALPMKTLMRIASEIDQNEEQRRFVLENDAEKIWELLKLEKTSKLREQIQNYLDLYGFRCNNEQKLEEKDLNDDPTFLFKNLQNYLRMKNYSVEKMKERELAIRDAAEKKALEHLAGIKKLLYFWTLKHARNAVKNRENLRFLRTKAFGVSRKLFRAVGKHLDRLEVLAAKEDVFFLNVDEIWDFIEGKAECLELSSLARIRRIDYENNMKCADPPERFMTFGAAGVSFRNIQILNAGDLVKNSVRISDDPDVLLGVSCCPGTVTGAVVVAQSIEEASNLNGEILVTKRTDPGWVPLYPSCSGLIIERGSLLSHSAVIARELGLPTIVGVGAGLMDKLKTGDRVELNATKGEVRILHDEN